MPCPPSLYVHACVRVRVRDRAVSATPRGRVGDGLFFFQGGGPGAMTSVSGGCASDEAEVKSARQGKVTNKQFVRFTGV